MILYRTSTIISQDYFGFVPHPRKLLLCN